MQEEEKKEKDVSPTMKAFLAVKRDVSLLTREAN
jgi:hypothetical protein